MRSVEFEVRRMIEDDWERYRAIRLEMLADTPSAFGETLASAESRDEVAWRDRLAASQGDSSVRFAAVLTSGDWSGAIGGYIKLNAGPGLVGVYVAPRFRGDDRGVTSALIAAVEDWARGHADSIRLDVHESNTRARKAYAKRGYVETGHTQPYPLDPMQFEVEMVKQLR
jgi:GNAT superfamily N-acetyltransferase